MSYKASIVSKSSSSSSATNHPVTILTQLPPETDLDANDDNAVSFEDYINDQSNIKAEDKNRYILCTIHGVIPDFSLTTPSYNSLKKLRIPTKMMFKQEILRRDSSQKLRKKSCCC